MKTLFLHPPSFELAELTADMLTSWEMTKRRLRGGVEFLRFLRTREV